MQRLPSPSPSGLHKLLSTENNEFKVFGLLSFLSVEAGGQIMPCWFLFKERMSPHPLQPHSQETCLAQQSPYAYTIHKHYQANSVELCCRRAIIKSYIMHIWLFDAFRSPNICISNVKAWGSWDLKTILTREFKRKLWGIEIHCDFLSLAAHSCTFFINKQGTEPE